MKKNNIKDKLQMNKDSLAKNIVTANVGDSFLMVVQEEAVLGSSFGASKYIITKETIMAKRGLNADLTEYDINDKYTVRRNSTTVEPGEVLFSEEQALGLVNKLNAIELKKVRDRIAELKAIESVVDQVNSLYEGKNSLDYNLPGQVIDIEINVKK